jgi:hypothetical protein
MGIFSSMIGLGNFFKTLANSQEAMVKVNNACSEKGLPPAFPISEDGKPSIPGNPEYRFEGFGAIIGIPPKMSFWVHYKPDSPEHVELGRFIVEIG